MFFCPCTNNSYEKSMKLHLWCLAGLDTYKPSWSENPRGREYREKWQHTECFYLFFDKHLFCNDHILDPWLNRNKYLNLKKTYLTIYNAAT